MTADADIFSPCAFGGVLTDTSVRAIRAKVICGGANNQLSNINVADALEARNIFYCPDYIANGGGIIDLHYQLNEEIDGGLPAHLDQLADALIATYAIARDNQVSMARATDRYAARRFLGHGH